MAEQFWIVHSLGTYSTNGTAALAGMFLGGALGVAYTRLGLKGLGFNGSNVIAHSRVIAIWACGLAASGLIGGLLVTAFLPTTPDMPPSGIWGVLLGAPAGMFSFACIRLWLA